MVKPSLFLFPLIVMLNLFQHPTGRLTSILKTMHMGCRNKFGMTYLFSNSNFFNSLPWEGCGWIRCNGREGFMYPVNLHCYETPTSLPQGTNRTAPRSSC